MRSDALVKFDSGVIFLDQSMNEIASFCIENRLQQMAFFMFAEVGKGQLSGYFKP